MRKWKRWLVVGGLLLCLTGCDKVFMKGTDPNTGAETKQLAPAAAEKIEEVATIVKIVETGATGASIYWPPAALIAGIAGGLLTMWKKLKPQLTKAQSEATIYHNTAESVVIALEGFKKICPDDWLKLELELTKAIGPNAENVIRALRGLPPKT